MGQANSSAVADDLKEQFSEPKALSVIIPALNEEDYIPKAIRSAVQDPDFHSRDEVIVVDGGSSDATCAVACKQGAKVYSSDKGRGRQMNVGAQHASGQYFLFLHADSQLPHGYRHLIEEALKRKRRRPGYWGCFQSIHLDVDDLGSRVLKSGIKCRTRFLHLPYGDQGIFVRASLFRQMGGYMEAPIMEDVDLVKRLCWRVGPPVIIPKHITTSSRRWEKLGYVRTALLNWALVCAYNLGANPTVLAKWYYGVGGNRTK